MHQKKLELRFCINYCDLNVKTIADVYLLPRIDDQLDVLSGAKYFLIFDASGTIWLEKCTSIVSAHYEQHLQKITLENVSTLHG
jgi:hypothetical protein